MSGGGWGASPWGSGEWGAGSVTALQLLAAVAVRENVLCLTFNAAPRFPRTLDPTDASNVERYSIVPVPGTYGADDEPTRPVRVVLVERAAIPFSFGSVLDVTVDRPFSPWASEYRVAVNQLETDGGVMLDPSATSLTFPGLYRMLRVQSTSNPLPSRDVANPQTYQDQLDPIPQAGDAAFLGVIPVSSDGDYAFDEGVANLRKRVLRRILTAPGGFASLPGYGVGIAQYGKRLGTAGVRQQLATESERQIALEPDVVSVKVRLFTDPTQPSITRLVATIRSHLGGDVVVQLPLQTG